MKYTGPIYRPPYEQNSLLLQVTVGCAHNHCTYCTMYKDTKFSIEKLEQIEKDLKEAKLTYKTIKRVYLLNGDPFVLPASILKNIATLIIEYFPEVEVITMYDQINNIKTKTDDELKELKKLRINELRIGLESGNKKALDYFNKGFNIDEAYKQLERLNKAGIKHIGIYMFGSAGTGRGIQNAIDTAKLINTSKHMAIATTTLGAFGDSQLSKDVESGIFKVATEKEVLEEQKKIFELINVENLEYLGIHAINTVRFDAIFPKDKENTIKKVDDALQNLPNEFLNSIPKRHAI